MKTYNIPIFVPHRGCPFDCVFCNQKRITGTQKEVKADDVHNIIGEYLQTLPSKNRRIEAAFFGGSFTGIPINEQSELLAAANEYLKKGDIDGIRLSTRPDYIDKEILDNLLKYGVTTIELGVQSMDDSVLKSSNRGHTREDVINAVKLIKEYPFTLGLQMMTGLYKDTEQYCIDTAKEFIALHCDTVRIYPTVILKNTELGRLHESGVYDSFTFEQTTRLCARLLDMFNKAGVAVIRMGLHASRDVEQEMIGGVYHPALREIAESILYLEKMNAVCEDGGKYVFYTDKRNISKIIGQGGANRNALSQRGISFKIKEEKGTDFRAERIG